ncbi:hypothetical protein K402DRAFT_424879 [Aulographum hederae CBS 113979]|uniref:THUMP domain-containing protein n=1 Tax=Aulographum hederae CBS 113979 TaxID=1176131 RepID=A0A6G1GMH5_9PEZI|nr:hypothetical protein K402DRAFT_424879 [Aulographum hederae CBS 113979]
MPDTIPKRKRDADAGAERNKKQKVKKPWRTPKQSQTDDITGLSQRSIEPGDVGIWATCSMNKEAKSVGDLRHIFNHYAARLYGTGVDAEDQQDADPSADIEAELKKELDDLKKPAEEPLFTPIKLQTQCLLFFKCRKPLEPVSFAQAICEDAANKTLRSRCRFVKRLTPISMVGKATVSGLDEVAQQVLAPHFHEPGVTPKTFAIRPSIRNHNHPLTRDPVIKQVAAAVGAWGPGHRVDLKEPDLVVIIEIYQNICGMSVVDGRDFERLKRFNLSEIFEPTVQKPSAASGKEAEMVNKTTDSEVMASDQAVAVQNDHDSASILRRAAAEQEQVADADVNADSLLAADAAAAAAVVEASSPPGAE